MGMFGVVAQHQPEQHLATDPQAAEPKAQQATEFVSNKRRKICHEDSTYVAVEGSGSEQIQESPLAALPMDLVAEIASHLDAKSLQALALTNKKFSGKYARTGLKFPQACAKAAVETLTGPGPAGEERAKRWR